MDTVYVRKDPVSSLPLEPLETGVPPFRIVVRQTVPWEVSLQWSELARKKHHETILEQLSEHLRKSSGLDTNIGGRSRSYFLFFLRSAHRFFISSESRLLPAVVR
jgi:hypothetical protein